MLVSEHAVSESTGSSADASSAAGVPKLAVVRGRTRLDRALYSLCKAKKEKADTKNNTSG